MQKNADIFYHFGISYTRKFEMMILLSKKQNRLHGSHWTMKAKIGWQQFYRITL